PLLRALASYDEAVAAQAAALCQAAGHDVQAGAFARLLDSAAEPVRRGFPAVASSTERLSGRTITEVPGERCARWCATGRPHTIPVRSVGIAATQPKVVHSPSSS